ncbi:MAG: peptidylprolyl isomerase [Thermodesulfobacteriota bacterium]
MLKVKEGDYVTITYEGTLASGEVFESATEDNPFEFALGQQCVFPSFEAGIIGMAPGETKTIKVGPEEAYGTRRDDLVHILNRSAFGEKTDPQPGMIVGMTMEKDGQEHQVPAMVMAADGDQITVDYNHPLAGQELLFKITLQTIGEAEESTATGGCGNASNSCGAN